MTIVPDNGVALSVLLNLIEDYHDFNPETIVPVCPYPTSLQFTQQVARGRPCVYLLDRSALRGQDEGSDNADGVAVGGVSCPRLVEGHLWQEQKSILGARCFSWTKRTLCEPFKEDVEVAITPDGRADSIYSLPRKWRRKSNKPHQPHTDGHEIEHYLRNGVEQLDLPDGPQDEAVEQVFLQPATTYMPLSRLIDELCPPQSSSSSKSSYKPVYYLQSQDSNLSRPEMSPLLAHLPTAPPSFAHSVLGDPEATNIWIGNERSVTSTHRDPYENLYLVVNGRKKFVLYPPVEEICLHAEMFRTGRWVYDEATEKFEVVVDGSPTADKEETPSNAKDGPNETAAPIPWIPIDPLDPPPRSSKAYPYYKYARPMTVTVNEGEILYLPAGWFHHVTQECGQWEDFGRLTPAPCIAINYWFDMEYSGEKHVMREMVGRLVERVRKVGPTRNLME